MTPAPALQSWLWTAPDQELHARHNGTASTRSTVNLSLLIICHQSVYVNVDRNGVQIRAVGTLRDLEQVSKLEAVVISYAMKNRWEAGFAGGFV